MTRWDWFTDNRVYDRKRVARDELELRYQHHQIYTKKGHGNILTPLAYMNRLRNSLKSIPKDLLHQCNMEHRYDYINRKGVIRDKTFKKGGCVSRKYGLVTSELRFMDKQYQEYLRIEEIKDQNKIVLQKIKDKQEQVTQKEIIEKDVTPEIPTKFILVSGIIGAIYLVSRK